MNETELERIARELKAAEEEFRSADELVVRARTIAVMAEQRVTKLRAQMSAYVRSVCEKA